MNNRISNLRDVTRSANMQNLKKARKDNKSGLAGVSKGRWGRYIANISINGKNKHIGTFNTPEDAYMAYIEQKRKHHFGYVI